MRGRGHPPVILRAAAAVSLFLCLAARPSPAADGAPPEPAADDTPRTTVPAAGAGWLDRYHSRVERNLFETASWFDRFFGGERMQVAEPPESLLRWMNDLRWDEEERFTFRSTFRVNLRLPRLKNRWRLVVSGETRGDPIAVHPEDPGNPGADVGSTVRRGSTEIAYDIVRTPHSLLDAAAGVRVKIPPDAFVRTRFQHARPIGFGALGRLTATAFRDARNGFGETNQLDLERPLAPPTLLRWSNSMSITEAGRWWTWGTELSLLHRISPKSAVTLAAGASGSTHPAWIAQNHRVLARYRRNVWRKWLFLEWEPYVRWPRKEDGSRPAVPGATMRLEVLFTGTEPEGGPAQTGGNC